MPLDIVDSVCMFSQPVTRRVHPTFGEETPRLKVVYLP